jgi:hypothetical protein
VSDVIAYILVVALETRMGHFIVREGFRLFPVLVPIITGLVQE